MTVLEKRKRLYEHCCKRMCSNCKIGKKYGDSNHPCGYGYAFAGMYKVDDATVEEYYDIVFGNEEKQKKEITITADKLIEACAKAAAEMCVENPSTFILHDVLETMATKTACILFYGDDSDE